MPEIFFQELNIFSEEGIQYCAVFHVHQEIAR